MCFLLNRKTWLFFHSLYRLTIDKYVAVPGMPEKRIPLAGVSLPKRGSSYLVHSIPIYQFNYQVATSPSVRGSVPPLSTPVLLFLQII